MKVDQVHLYTTEPHFERHLRPVLEALPREVRGRHFRGLSEGVCSVIARERPLFLAASYGNYARLAALGARVALFDHGAGQRYDGGKLRVSRADADVPPPVLYCTTGPTAAASTLLSMTDAAAYIDAFASERHFIDHLAPVWRTLPEERRGTLYTVDDLCGYAAQALGGAASVGRRREGAQGVLAGSEAAYVLTAASADQIQAARAGKQSIFSEHGAGQTYRRRHSSYAGWKGRKGVCLFLCAGEHPASRNRQAYPGVLVIAQGAQVLDAWHRGEMPMPQNTEPVIAVSFHWNCQVVPETTSGFAYFQSGVLALARRYRVLGHAHPRLWEAARPFYERHGIEAVASFEEVLRRADVYCVDNSSTLFEFAAAAPEGQSRPVVVLNPPQYRRDVSHGLRFWECASIGVNCDRPQDLPAAVEEALQDAPDRQEAREVALSKVYGARDGHAAERAASAILALLRGETPPAPPAKPPRQRVKHFGTAAGLPMNGHKKAMDEEKNVRMRALVTFRNRHHEGDVVRGRIFHTTERRAKLLEGTHAVREPARQIGPTLTKPDRPALTKHHTGGGYYEIRRGSEVLDRVKGKAAADERITELA